MSVEVSSPKVEKVLKGKILQLYRSIFCSEKYAGIIFLSMDERIGPDLVFVCHLGNDTTSFQMYDPSNPCFPGLINDLQVNLNQEWIEIAKCDTFPIHVVLRMLVDHLENLNNMDANKPDERKKTEGNPS